MSPEIRNWGQLSENRQEWFPSTPIKCRPADVERIETMVGILRDCGADLLREATRQEIVPAPDCVVVATDLPDKSFFVMLEVPPLCAERSAPSPLFLLLFPALKSSLPQETKKNWLRPKQP